MNRRYYLKNKRRFYSILVVLGILILSSFWAVSAQGGGSQPAYKVMRVASGDTLWNIAKEYEPNGDIRAFIDEIKELNGMEKSIIYAGEELKIPVHFYAEK